MAEPMYVPRKNARIEPVVPDARTAQGWFDLGERVPYDPRRKRIVAATDRAGDSNDVVKAFRRVVSESDRAGVGWTTFLPGFPDGSYGWEAVERHLGEDGPAPRLFVEYIGQGDSDKPAEHPYGTVERADLVEAHWRQLDVRSTFLVSFDYSSIVALELLSRQLDRIEAGAELGTRIEGVLSINGGLFADGHSHPVLTTPLLKTRLGRIGTWLAQRSPFVFDQMMKPLWSEEYGVTDDELGEVREAITRRDGAAFMSRAAGFVDEHKANAERWDLRRLFLALRDSVSFHLVGSENDQFEPNQIARARERLGEQGIDIRMVPGGHMTTSEQPELLAAIILETVRA